MGTNLYYMVVKTTKSCLFLFLLLISSSGVWAAPAIDILTPSGTVLLHSADSGVGFVFRYSSQGSGLGNATCNITIDGKLEAADVAASDRMMGWYAAANPLSGSHIWQVKCRAFDANQSSKRQPILIQSASQSYELKLETAPGAGDEELQGRAADGDYGLKLAVISDGNLSNNFYPAKDESTGVFSDFSRKIVVAGNAFILMIFGAFVLLLLVVWVGVKTKKLNLTSELARIGFMENGKMAEETEAVKNGAETGTPKNGTGTGESFSEETNSGQGEMQTQMDAAPPEEMGTEIQEITHALQQQKTKGASGKGKKLAKGKSAQKIESKQTVKSSKKSVKSSSGSKKVQNKKRPAQR